jgi:hypothetical protein
VPPASPNEEKAGNRRPQGKGQKALTRHSGMKQFKKPSASSSGNKGRANSTTKSKRK